MEYQLSRKGSLPASRLHKTFLDELWQLLSRQGDFIWNAVIETGSENMGKASGREQRMVHDWQQLVDVLASQDTVFFQLTVEYPEQGSLSFVFKNYHPAGGSLVVAGTEQLWVDTVFQAIDRLFAPAADPFVTRIYSRYGVFFLHLLLPLSTAFILVVLAAALLIPGDVRRSEFIWWIAVGTVLATFKLGQLLSDRLIGYVSRKYPYLSWR